MLYDVERSARPFALLAEFAGRVSVEPASDLESHLPDAWAARVVVRAGKERLEETVIRAPFDAGAKDLPRLLEEKWRRLLPEEHVCEILNQAAIGPAVLWQEIERCVSMAAKRP
jgi:hypothetical protein